jgi:hypothetical protein
MQCALMRGQHAGLSISHACHVVCYALIAHYARSCCLLSLALQHPFLWQLLVAGAACRSVSHACCLLHSLHRLAETVLFSTFPAGTCPTATWLTR